MPHPYLTIDDLYRKMTVNNVLVFSRDDDGQAEGAEADEEVLDAIFESVSSEIDGYISNVTATPLEVVPGAITEVAVKLSVYELYSRRGMAELESHKHIARMRSDGIRYLEMISKGQINPFGAGPSAVAEAADPAVATVTRPASWNDDPSLAGL